MRVSPIIAPGGAWKSPLTPEVMVADGVRLGGVALDGDDTYWVEGRAVEGGRNVVVRGPGAGGGGGDVNPAPFSVRSRVHEYGGGAFLASGGRVWFVNDTDQHLYCQEPGGAPALLAGAEGARYADLTLDRRRRRLVCVAEHHGEPGSEPSNRLVGIDLSTGAEEVLVAGHDFVASPRLSADGRRLAWLSWEHPNMPWDGTDLWVSELTESGGVSGAKRLSGGAAESIFQPEWAPDGTLYFVSDAEGWWNLYRFDGEKRVPLCPMAREFGRPQWQFGMATYGIDDSGRVIASSCDRGIWRLMELAPDGGGIRHYDLPFRDLDALRVARGRAVFIGSAAGEPASVVELDLATGRHQVLKRSATVTFGDAYLSRPETLEFATGGGETAHAFFYRPGNRDYALAPAARPPLLVTGHGGPTASASSGLNLAIQFWTSRGFAVADVNYRGSTGYGRAYRERLNGMWGVYDVEDCVNAARFLAEAGRVDGGKLAIRGGSAGGYTALAALTFHDLFTAGASYYGISELEALARDTHKFESRYLDRLIGPYPERRDLYFERSPINFTERLACPLIFFQGLEDPVVPPSQADMMVGALREKGLPVAYLSFPGEQHGFRAAATIKRCLEAELYFYGRIFGFEPADILEPIPIENLRP